MEQIKTWPELLEVPDGSFAELKNFTDTDGVKHRKGLAVVYQIRNKLDYCKVPGGTPRSPGCLFVIEWEGRISVLGVVMIEDWSGQDVIPARDIEFAEHDIDFGGSVGSVQFNIISALLIINGLIEKRIQITRQAQQLLNMI
ncbi:hypothetical protein HN858_05065 [Candidatus Falkowbacteria bacterium]|jgi:hypothetical protein|nr:hypothetical protein [Candidatus Falkowbacteria bacterium]MBT5502594.1 hypothetical protein [Candidatus Falkowbacteria bacterium]MBT6574597.1 hypothetical protein [Candidatus Falkowbacteria bacterium]MBT7349008.1 hypothetical protein [Candidatus Falkowbacteria bacterium]MBT7500350.1 hypothetical protein [Candidatus Falkowbacteria bacterium]